MTENKILLQPLNCPKDYIQSIDQYNNNVCVGSMNQKYILNGNKSYIQNKDPVTCNWGSANFDIYGNPVCIYRTKEFSRFI